MVFNPSLAGASTTPLHTFQRVTAKRIAHVLLASRLGLRDLAQRVTGCHRGRGCGHQYFKQLLSRRHHQRRFPPAIAHLRPERPLPAHDWPQAPSSSCKGMMSLPVREIAAYQRVSWELYAPGRMAYDANFPSAGSGLELPNYGPLVVAATG